MYVLFSRVLIPRGRIVILTSSAMNNFKRKMTCSVEQSASSKRFGKKEVGGFDTMHNSSGSVIEKTNNKVGESGHDCGLIENTATEIVCELANIKNDDKRECESMQTKEDTINYEALLAEDSSGKMEDKKAIDRVEVSDVGKKLSDARTEAEMLNTDHVCRSESENKSREMENRSEINCLRFLESHYVKLGETHAYICVLEKSAVT